MNIHSQEFEQSRLAPQNISLDRGVLAIVDGYIAEMRRYCLKLEAGLSVSSENVGTSICEYSIIRRRSSFGLSQ